MFAAISARNNCYSYTIAAAKAASKGLNSSSLAFKTSRTSRIPQFKFYSLQQQQQQFIRTMVTAKAIIYSEHGEPQQQIKVHSYTINDPKGNEIVLKTLAHPINPSDINQIEGVYPSKPEKTTALGTKEPSAVAGNEGLSKVIQVGPDVKHLKVGDWVIPNFPNYGTWRSHSQGKDDEYIKIDNPNDNLSYNAIACISVNTCTAYELLTTITKLNKGDWFITNAGTSSVARFAVQIGKLLGFNSISVVRDRPDIDALKKELTDLGATHVITEEENSSKEFGKQIKEWVAQTDGKIKLALNSVGGKSSANISRKLDNGGVIVTYGGMSKQPVTFPTSLFIFKDIAAKGYWITKNNFANLEQKKKTVATVLKYYQEDKLKPTAAEEVLIDAEKASDEEILQFYKNALGKKGKQLVVYKD